MTFVDKSIGFPDTFPFDALNRAHSRVQNRHVLSPETCVEFSTAWGAVAYRYLACTEHNDAFTHSFERAGDSPPFPERYVQERELFGFFYTGISAIECYCYGIFAMGHILAPDNFPFSASDRHVATRGNTVKFLTKPTSDKALQQDMIKLSGKINVILTSDEFRQWFEVRNVLTHRISPGRHFGLILSSGEPLRQTTGWFRGLSIDSQTTSKLHDWVTVAITSLATAADEFTAIHF